MREANRKLPIGIQDFEKIRREEVCIYDGGDQVQQGEHLQRPKSLIPVNEPSMAGRLYGNLYSLLQKGVSF